ncbi:MAG: hypothetical protein COS47_00160 [Candidatus Nealsonbacteria bacterium CG03_land_8_20_14_0_80_36_12]|uniref:PEGA domain-containing protein n=1 Tax=Candidatus Nealsonbacteria bacterium CG03_land_8_20_14_0_80_36_12 TaxID=1974701 RepID=A0A2M7BYZ1_9BACT|nr:MAG: hypothetical protein COS47_00160 [Candidatus Nealsonbacteria bacterium CG03_land_8_20_14_0_80_36_12]
MTRKLRKCLFFSLLALFIIVVPLILSYSQGYRFDFENKKIVRTGAFYFKVFPSGAEIYLNGKLEKKTSFLGSALIENLLPKKYEIEIKKEGYHLWKKSLEIKEAKVSEAKNIILWPENPKFELLEKGVKDSSLLLDEEKIISEEEISSILKNPITYQIFPNNIIWLAPDGFIYKSDFAGKLLEVLNLKPISIKKEIEYQIFFEKENLFLKEGLNLLYLNPKTREFEKIFDSLSNLSFSPDYKKAVLTNNWEIWILFLEKIYGQPQKEAGEKLFLTRFSEEINQIFWLNSHYLIFNTGNKLKIVEIDDRDRINIIDLAEFKNPKIYFSKKSLYLLSNENLYSLEKLIP